MRAVIFGGPGGVAMGGGPGREAREGKRAGYIIVVGSVRSTERRGYVGLCREREGGGLVVPIYAMR